MEALFFDEYLRQVLPVLAAIENPRTALVECEKQWRLFRRKFPGVVGARKFFAQIEVKAFDKITEETP
jgi:hypothetical protein